MEERKQVTTRRQAAAREYAINKYTREQWITDGIEDFLAGAEAEAAAGVECWVVEIFDAELTPGFSHRLGVFLDDKLVQPYLNGQSTAHQAGWKVRIRPARLVLSDE